MAIHIWESREQYAQNSAVHPRQTIAHPRSLTAAAGTPLYPPGDLCQHPPMVADSENIVLLLVVCCGLVAALYARALWRRPKNEDVAHAVQRADAVSDAEVLLSWSRAVGMALLGGGLIGLLPIAAALHAESADGSNGAAALVHVLAVSAPALLGIVYWHRCSRPDGK